MFVNFLNCWKNIFWICWNAFSVIWFVQNKKPILFDTQNLALWCLINFNFFCFFHNSFFLNLQATSSRILIFWYPSTVNQDQNVVCAWPSYCASSIQIEKQIHRTRDISMFDRKLTYLGPPVNCQPSHWREGS